MIRIINNYNKLNNINFNKTRKIFNLNIKKFCSSSNSSPETTKVRFRIWKDIWSYFRMKNRIVAGIGIIFGGSFLFYNRDEFLSINPNKLILDAIENELGLNKYNKNDKSASVERLELKNDLKKIIRPNYSKQYAVIVGENGCGKSTAIRNCIREIDGKKGVIYINCPENAKLFSRELSKIIGYKTEMDIKSGFKRFLSGMTIEEKEPDMKEEPLATYNKIGEHLINSASEFRNKNDRPLVLVIDSADILAKNEPAFLGILQDFAKDDADAGNLRIVFVSSDGSVLPLLMSRSSWSRAEPPYEVGEISSKDAINYLVQNKVDEEIAKIAADTITGGNFSMLKKFIKQHVTNKMTINYIREQMDIKLNASLIDNNIPVNHKLFIELVRDGSIKQDKAIDFMNTDIINSLLKANILAVHVNGTYTFHDRYTQTFFKNALNEKQMNIEK